MKIIFRVGMPVFIIILIIMGLIYFNHNSSQKSAVLKTSVGQIVPIKWQKKAKSLGYYCPSWNISSGVVSSSICISLAK